MRAITEYKNGNMEMTIGGETGRSLIASVLKNWLFTCEQDRTCVQNPPEKIWIVLDELGEEFDEGADPAWTGPAKIQTAAIFNPDAGDEDLGIVVSCVVRECETWLDALKFQYPETWNAIVSIRGMWSEHCELSDWLDITVPADCDAAEYVYTGRPVHD